MTQRYATVVVTEHRYRNPWWYQGSGAAAWNRPYFERIIVTPYGDPLPWLP